MAKKLYTKLGRINWKNGCLKMLKSQNVTNVPCYNVTNKHSIFNIKLLIVLEHYTNISKRCSAKLLKSCLNMEKQNNNSLPGLANKFDIHICLLVLPFDVGTTNYLTTITILDYKQYLMFHYKKVLKDKKFVVYI
jgi:hypothetical protein